ncbi:MAG TPA: anti-sigma factor [Chitinophagaceae bacterium]
MNIREYIASGIIESYVLGLASEKEKAEFERFCAIYPELQKERTRFELSLEQTVFENVMEPPAEEKIKLFDAINQQQSVALTTNAVLMDAAKKTPVQKVSSMRWAIAASVILLVGCGLFIISLYKKNQELQAEIAESIKTIDQLDQKTQQIEESIVPDGAALKQAKVVMPQQAIKATVNVYWDSTTADVYLVIRDLLALQPDEKYNVWSVTNGNYNSLGLFDSPANANLVLKINNARNADSFAITVVKKDR